MSDDELAFWMAIHATPRDSTPRLVFADWLDEHDQPERAELIRLQCATPFRQEVPPPITVEFASPPRLALANQSVNRVSAILFEHWKAWVPPLPEGRRVHCFSRGAPVATGSGLIGLRDLPPQLRLDVTTTTAGLFSVIHSPNANRVDHLTIMHGLRDDPEQLLLAAQVIGDSSLFFTLERFTVEGLSERHGSPIADGIRFILEGIEVVV